MRTITLPPRIEPQRLAVDLVTECPAVPKPDAATPRKVAKYLERETARADCNAYKLEQIGKQVEVVR